MAQKRKPKKRSTTKQGNPYSGGRLLSIFGPFSSRALVEVSADAALKGFGVSVEEAARAEVIEAVQRDLEALRKRSPDLAESSLAAVVMRLAYELEHPFNSATSKSMCAGRLVEAMDRLRELAPEEEGEDRLDELQARRGARRAAS